jgi:hypothetical protein
MHDRELIAGLAEHRWVIQSLQPTEKTMIVVATAKDFVSTAKSSVSTAKVSVSTEKSSVSIAKSFVSTAKSSVSTAKGSVSTTKSYVSKAKGFVSMAKSSASTAKCSVSTAKSSVSKLFRFQQREVGLNSVSCACETTPLSVKASQAARRHPPDAPSLPVAKRERLQDGWR